ncbi:hypothetical protein EYF80_022805 [Liparis tanakae]|uniref:Uncharacterized protein n=1 Tax=Liparis tanakae TaxID=230148 RepID=A0A4Z2HQH5_9TELE|nr:hypothetical protein EYF80_022805 [Liparis tanakae]
MAWRRDEGRGVQHGWAELKCEQRERPVAHSTSLMVRLRPTGGRQTKRAQSCLGHTEPTQRGIGALQQQLEVQQITPQTWQSLSHLLPARDSYMDVPTVEAVWTMTTIHLGGGVMEEKLREGNRIKGYYALLDRYGDEERVAWTPDPVG